mgnify:CR=1 FL=1
MKKTFVTFLMIAVFASFQSYGQGGLLKKVGSAMKDELLGTGNSASSSKQQTPEPACACAQPLMVVDLGGKLKLDYSEITINTAEDGSLIIQDRISGNFYLAKGGSLTGPIPAGDPRLAGFDNSMPNNSDGIAAKYNKYISKADGRYTIKFGGKNYGPYDNISQFEVTKAGNQFAALVIETVPTTEDEAKKFEKAANNAKTDQEKMDLAMQYAQQMQQKMMAGGGPESMQTKLISNVPDLTYQPQLGATLQGKYKYDEIVLMAYTKILDLKGNTLVTIKNDFVGVEKFFISSDNQKYAAYNYGELKFSDNTTLKELFNPQLEKTDGKVYLTYMYYSPKSNAIMQCKIPF